MHIWLLAWELWSLISTGPLRGEWRKWSEPYYAEEQIQCRVPGGDVIESLPSFLQVCMYWSDLLSGVEFSVDLTSRWSGWLRNYLGSTSQEVCDSIPWSVGVRAVVSRSYCGARTCCV